MWMLWEMKRNKIEKEKKEIKLKKKDKWGEDRSLPM